MGKFISRTERAYLVVYSIFVSLVSLTNLIITASYPSIYPREFQIDGMARASLFPWFCLLILFVPFSILWANRFFLATIYTLLALMPAYLEFIRDFYALQVDFELYEKNSSLRILLLVASPLDYATFIMANLLLVWLVSVVIRSYAGGSDE